MTAMSTPRLTLPRTSPLMYAEYWNPMNWNSITLAMNITGHEVSDSGPKLNESPVSPASVAAFASESTVVPFANFGRFVANWPASKKTRPKTAMSAQPTMPSTVSQVTILCQASGIAHPSVGRHGPHARLGQPERRQLLALRRRSDVWAGGPPTWR